MTATTPTHVDSAIPEIWAQEVLRDHLVSGFWAKFVGGEGSSAALVQKTELLNKPGDLIHIQTTVPLAGAGLSGDTAKLDGNEENLTTAEIKVAPVYYRHGVRWYRRANKKSIVGLREEAKMRLAEWGGQKMDALRFSQFVSTNGADVPDGAYAANEYTIAAEGGVSKKTVAASTLSVKELQTIKLRLVNQRAKPMMTDAGEPVYGIVVHPNAAFDLKRETEYQTWVRDAQIRGDRNPFFRGALAMIDGMVVYEHPNVPTYASAGTGAVKSATNIAFGSNAFVEGVDENPDWAEQEFDYGNEIGIGYGFAFQPRRALKLSSLLVYSAAVDK
jgi:N4-gp56 family major capsid protein